MARQIICGQCGCSYVDGLKVVQTFRGAIDRNSKGEDYCSLLCLAVASKEIVAKAVNEVHRALDKFAVEKRHA